MKFRLLNHRNWLLGLFCLWLTVGAAFSAERSGVVNEYQVKAALVYNFTKFTEWPAHAFASADAPIVIGILGDDPFGPTIDEAMAGETCDGHPIVVKRFTREDALTDCHILFVSRSEKDRLQSILAVVRDRPILAISENQGFGQLGGMVNFVVVDKMIRFEINAGAAQQAGVKISSKLLNLPKAIKVETHKP